MTTHCPNCGFTVRETSRYCSDCGTLLPEGYQDNEEAKGSGYQSLLRETAYLDPEWRDKAEAAIKQQDTNLSTPEKNSFQFIPKKMGAYRSVLLVVFLPCITLGMYTLYWWWQTGNEIRDYLGGNEPSPSRDLTLTMLTCGLWRLHMHYSYASRIAEMQRHSQLPSNDSLKYICPLLSLF